MNEYKGTPYTCMRAHGYCCTRPHTQGDPMYSFTS